MVRTPQSRRSKPTRKPVTLDLQAEKTPKDTRAGGTVPEAEPVAFDTSRAGGPGTGASKTGSPAASAKAEARDSADGKREETAAASAASGAHASGSSAAGSGGKTPPPRGPSAPLPRSSSGGIAGALGAGLIGGVIALVLAGLMQWAGILPSPRSGADLDPLQTRLDELRGDVDTLRQSGPAGTPEELQAQIDSASAAASSSQEALETLRDQVETLNQQVTGLSDAVSSGEAGDAPGLETLAERINNLESTVSGLSEAPTDGGEAAAGLQDTVGGLSDEFAQMRQRVDELSGAVDSIPGSTEERFASLDQRVGDVSAQLSSLEDRVAKIEEDIDAGAGSRVAAAIAASSLKNAVDRGGAFMTELESFAAVGGSQESVDAMRTYAASGVPTLAQLNERYPNVANRIVAVADGVGPDSGIGDRLMASARNLVQVRPVGDVEGDSPGAISARMEVALKNGNLQRFLDEWDTLPDLSKDVSKKFASDVRARMRVDSLIGDVLTGAMQDANPAKGE